MNVRTLLFALVAFVAVNVGASSMPKILDTIHAWKQMEYDFAEEDDRDTANANGYLQNGVGTLTDVGVHYNTDGSRRIFVTIPRKAGVPYSLAVATNRPGENGTLVKAYPDYATHWNPLKCDTIISAFRIAIDECNRMWVMDIGIVDNNQTCPPKLVVIDLTSNEVRDRFELPPGVHRGNSSLLTTPIVDVRDPPGQGNCSQTMVYIPDVYQPGLIVYDAQKKAWWRIENSRMEPDPKLSNHTVAGEQFTLAAGIFGLSVDPPKRQGERKLYFHALSSHAEIAVPLSLLNNGSIWSANPKAQSSNFIEIGDRGVECTVEAMDRRGFLYCVTMDPIRLIAWHISTPYNQQSMTVLSTDVETLQFASGLKVVKNSLGEEELWIATDRFQKIATGTLKPDEVNFRILSYKLKNLWNGFECSQQPDQGSN